MRMERFGWPVAFIALGALALMTVLLVAREAGAGPLDPPGAAGGPTGTQKTQNQIEPRTPIESLPYTISSPGSYYLTGNLTGASGSNGITITASQVTLDLNGYAINGVAGSLSGISASGGNVAIKNGVVNNWGADGINAASAVNTRLDDLRVSGSGLAGIVVGADSTLSRCSVFANGTAASGLRAGVRVAGNRAIVEDCNLAFNYCDGIRVEGSWSLVRDNHIAEHRTCFGNGIGVVGDRNVIERNTSAYNLCGIAIAANDNRIHSNTFFGNTSCTFLDNGVGNLYELDTAYNDNHPFANIIGP